MTSRGSKQVSGCCVDFVMTMTSPPSPQGSDDQLVSFRDVAGASPTRDGKRCIDKVEMVEETEYDDVVQCDHSYDKRCHTSYVPNYESQQEEECEEKKKNCTVRSITPSIVGEVGGVSSASSGCWIAKIA